MKKIGTQHTGVFAKNVAPNGSADRAFGSNNGGVKSGDKIIQVNNTLLDSLSYNDVISFFKKIPKKSTFVLKRVCSQEDARSHELNDKRESSLRPIKRMAIMFCRRIFVFVSYKLR